MFCHQCGYEIAQHANYCSYCGARQNTSGNHQQSSRFDWDNFTNFLKTNISRKLVGYYLIWILLHSFLWAQSYRKYYKIRNKFWPFESNDLLYYDISEFLFYSISPILIFMIIKLIKSSKD